MNKDLKNISVPSFEGWKGDNYLRANLNLKACFGKSLKVAECMSVHRGEMVPYVRVYT